MNKFLSFQKYLRNELHLAESSIKHYSTELNGRIADYAVQYYPSFEDLFILPKEDAMMLIRKLKDDQALIAHSKTSHDVQITALTHYYNFLKLLK